MCMRTLEDWLTLPMAAERWGVTRGRVWTLVTSEVEKLPEAVVVKVRDRWLLDPEFVQAVSDHIDRGGGRYKVEKAIKDVAAKYGGGGEDGV